MASHSRAGVTSLTACLVVWLLIYIWDAHIRTDALVGIRPKLGKSACGEALINSLNPAVKVRLVWDGGNKRAVFHIEGRERL